MNNKSKKQVIAIRVIAGVMAAVMILSLFAYF